MTPTLKPRGVEILARKPGGCKLCPHPIRPGQAVLKLDPMGWVHAPCGDGYRRVLAEHGVEEVGS